MATLITCKSCLQKKPSFAVHKSTGICFVCALNAHTAQQTFAEAYINKILNESILSWIDEAIMRGSYAKNYGKYGQNPYGNSSRDTISCRWIPQAAAYKCHFPYNKTFIELIKAKIPANGGRLYDPSDNHAWYIAEQYFDALLPIIRATFANCAFNIITRAKVEEYSRGMASTQVVSTDKLAEEFYLLLERAGLSPDRTALEEKLVKRDYLRAARYYHPDLKPEFAGEMSRLNELWSNLKGIYFK